MNSFSQVMFTTIPFIAFVANVFLLSTLLSAKKDGPVISFMGLLGAFILWTGGSYCMRMQFMPGTAFWWRVSLTGIFLVPYMYYLLVAGYTEQKGKFLKALWGVVTLFLVIGNFTGIFMTTPKISMENGKITSVYALKWPAVFAVFFALLILVSVFLTIRKSLRTGTVSIISLVPLFIGVGILILGIILNALPALTSIPFDTLGCALNACCIYYAFYKKRFYAISQMTSKGSTFIIALLITGFLSYQFFEPACALTARLTAGNVSNPTVIVSVAAVAVGILLFLLFNKLNDGLVVRDQIRREYHVREFSKAVNSTLRLDEILNLLIEVIKDEVPVSHVYLCMKGEGGGFATSRTLQSLDHVVSFSADHPLVECISRDTNGFLYEDFRRNAFGKGMYETEKQLLERLDCEYILPFTDNNAILGFAILSGKDNHKAYTYNEINYLESVASVASIALKNSKLYEELEQEAQRDVLTGLYNRRAITRTLQKEIDGGAKQLSFILFNLDDFSLYNELYGNDEGDIFLQSFAKMLLSVFGNSSMTARYSGKEFAVLLPGVDVNTAKRQAERVRDKLQDFMNIGDEKTRKFLTFSAGICSYPSLAGNANQLISYANLTVFHIKQHGKNQIEVYSSKDRQENNKSDNNIQELSSTIYALTAAIDAKDHYTFNHSRCVSEYAGQLAEFAGLDSNMVEVIRQAGFLHDIGKIGIPDAILSKTGTLTPEEFSIMRQHVERSIEMIRHLPSLDYVIPAVVGHHERYDGSGYPRGISGDAIPQSARCLAIADSFDAMVSKRSYKNKMPVETALSEIENNLGTQFDPVLGKLFVQLVREEKIKVIVY